MNIKIEAFVSDLELVVEIYREERIKKFQSYTDFVEDDYIEKRIAYFENASIEDLTKDLFFEKIFDTKQKYGIEF